MRRNAFSLILAAGLFAGPIYTGSAQANPANLKERVQDRSEKTQDKQERRDDRLDVQQLEEILARFDRSRASRNLPALDAVDGDLRRILQTELAEGRFEKAADNREAAASGGELRSDNRELAKNAATGAGPGAMADDLHDRRDDKRDLRDDKQDAAREAAQQRDRRAIAQELGPLLGRQDPIALDKKRGLIVELVGAARAEMRGNQQEKKEDTKERREDRRERTEDRR